MPITPFHLIAITPVKAIAKKKFSFSIFALTNVVIDLEPISYYLITLYPSHRFFHTIIGASLIAVICALFGRRICEKAKIIWNEGKKENCKDRWLNLDERITKLAAWSGALTGSYTHLLLDSFMHNDIMPLSPFTDKNVLLGIIDIDYLHSACLVSGFIGLAILMYLKWKE